MKTKKKLLRNSILRGGQGGDDDDADAVVPGAGGAAVPGPVMAEAVHYVPGAGGAAPPPGAPPVHHVPVGDAEEVVVTIGKFQGLTRQHVAMMRYVSRIAQERKADMVIIVSSRENVVDDGITDAITELTDLQKRRKKLNPKQKDKLKELKKKRAKYNRIGREFEKKEGKNDAPIPASIRKQHILSQIVNGDVKIGNPGTELKKLVISGKYKKMTLIIGGDRGGAFAPIITPLQEKYPIEIEEIVFGERDRKSENSISSSKLRAAILAENYYLGGVGRSTVSAGNKILTDYPTIETAREAIDDMTPLRGEYLEEMKHYIITNTGMGGGGRKTRRRRRKKTTRRRRRKKTTRRRRK